MLAFINFAGYLVTALALLGVFMYVYEKITPYREFQEIHNNNVAVAIAFGGAILGFVFPLVASIYFTHSYLEMIKWAVATGFIQIITFRTVRSFAPEVLAGHIAPAIFIAVLSMAVGLLNAVSISY